jgi:hypothetical protein
MCLTVAVVALGSFGTSSAPTGLLSRFSPPLSFSLKSEPSLLRSAYLAERASRGTPRAFLPLRQVRRVPLEKGDELPNMGL